MTMKYSRLVALVLALGLVLTGFSWPETGAQAEETVYGMVINSSVKLRKDATSGSATWFTLPVGWVCEIRSEKSSGGTHWYRVIAPHPEAKDLSTARTYWGYISSDYFRPLTEQETADYLATRSVSTAAVSSSPTSSAAGTTSSSGGSSSTAAASGTTGSITNGGTNFREGPGKKHRSMMRLDRGTVVNITSIPSSIGADEWYGVSYAGLNGYVNSEFIRVLSGGNSAQVTVSPTATPTPPPSTSGYNAVQLVLSSAHLRTSPNGSYDRDNDWEGTGSVLPLAGNAATAGGYTWYPVSAKGGTYYVRQDCVTLISTSAVTPAPASATATPVPAATTTAAPAAVGYVKTVKSGCNLRSTIAGTTIKQIPRNRTLPYLLTPVSQQGYTWYYVDADGVRGYLRSDVVKVVSSDGSTVTAAPDSVVPAVTADPNATGYVKTIASEVNLRTKAGYSSTIGRVAKGVIMPYYGTPTTVKGVTWYNVRSSTLGNGYIHGSYVAVVNADGSATPTPEPTPVPTGAVVTAPSGSQVEASYSTLKLGSTGTAVRNLVQALKDRGYFSGSVTNKYTNDVQKAVRNFQKAAGLSVDGIAGSATQHALYGTVPYGAADSNNLTMTLYPAEKIDWWTGGINTLWARGTNYKIYDVKTGIVWWAHRWAGGYHADVEPLTAADTARLCKAYGVTSASEIKSKNLYQRRPCLVTIGNRTFACSLYGVPHNPEGDTISNNDMTGQVCIHFTNSWTHSGKKVDSLHTSAIQYAWENAPNGHK